MGFERSTEWLSVLTDPTRLRVLAVLEDQELTVAELQRVLDLPQSRLSMHLARLRGGGWARDRVDGPHRFYRLSNGAPAMQQTWRAVRDSLQDDPQLKRDLERRAAVLAARQSSWIDRVAGSLDDEYSPGRNWESLARSLVLTCAFDVVADFGTGDGAMAELLAPYARKIIGIDSSKKMIAAGRERLRRAKIRNVSLMEGDMHQVPLEDGSVDFALVMHSLQYAERPAQVLGEVGRVLRCSGRALVVTLARHREELARSVYGHRHLGFRSRDLEHWARAAGLRPIRCVSAGREKRPPQFEALAMLVERVQHKRSQTR